MANERTLKVATPTDREIVMTRAFDAPRALVWDAMSKPEMLRRWLLGPPGWTITTFDDDLRAGGKFRWVWRGPDGSEIAMGGVYREVARPERIVRTESFEFGSAPPTGEQLATLVLTEQGAITALKLTLLYPSKEARDAAVASGVDRGLAVGYERLDDLLAPKPPREVDLVVTRVFDAPVEEVWRAWSDPEQVMQWWGPDRFTCPVAEIDFREGGTSLLCMRAPKEFGGQDMYSTWTYGKIDPKKRIELVHHFSDKARTKLDPAVIGMPPGIPKEVPHVITFHPLGANRTEMTVIERGYTMESARDLSKAGLEQCLDKMAALFARN